MGDFNKKESESLDFTGLKIPRDYDFVSGGRVIFTARCVRGKVTEVWDNRNDEPYVPSYRPSKPKDDTIEEDPYNAKDYSNEEDFYYDNYDDFFDYYDAEAYWQEYHD